MTSTQFVSLERHLRRAVPLLKEKQHFPPKYEKHFEISKITKSLAFSKTCDIIIHVYGNFIHPYSTVRYHYEQRM